MTETEREYLEIVKHLVKNNQGQIDGERPYLSALRARLRLSQPQADQIEQQVLSAYQTFLSRSQPQTLPHPSPSQLPNPATGNFPNGFTNVEYLDDLDYLDDDELDDLNAPFTPTFRQSSELAATELAATELAPTELAPTELPLTELPETTLPFTELPATELPETVLQPSASNVPLQPVSSQLAAITRSEQADLERTLQRRQWKEADQMTLKLMLKLTNAEEQGWLDAEAIGKLNCSDLAQIDRLWRRYSNEKFGFSPQWHVFSGLDRLPQFMPRSATGAPPRSVSQANPRSQANQQPLFSSNSPQTTNLDFQKVLAFCKKVGWWQPGGEFHRYYNQLTFDANANLRADVPAGHLPALWYWRIPWWKALQFGGIGPNRGGCRTDAQTILAFMKQLQVCESSPKTLPQTSPKSK